MSDNTTGSRSVGDYLAILQAKKSQLSADIDAAEKGLRGGGRPRGFQAEGRTDEEATSRGLAWLQGQVDADFLLPGLRWLHQDLSRLDVAGLPPWTGEPQDETTALYLLDAMILACQTLSSTPDNCADYRDDPGGSLLTAQYILKRYGISNAVLSRESKKNSSIRRKNPAGGSSYVYRYDFVSLLSNRKGSDD